jgi:hypothetical protein
MEVFAVLPAGAEGKYASPALEKARQRALKPAMKLLVIQAAELRGLKAPTRILRQREKQDLAHSGRRLLLEPPAERQARWKALCRAARLPVRPC